jgi:hypothetical protein
MVHSCLRASSVYRGYLRGSEFKMMTSERNSADVHVYSKLVLSYASTAVSDMVQTAGAYTAEMSLHALMTVCCMQAVFDMQQNVIMRSMTFLLDGASCSVSNRSDPALAACTALSQCAASSLVRASSAVTVAKHSGTCNCDELLD